MLRLYDNRLSGNGYMARLTLTQKSGLGGSSPMRPSANWLGRVQEQPGHIPMGPASEGVIASIK